MIERLPTRAAAALASLAFAVGSVVTYAAERVYEASRSAPIDPSLILMSAHVAYPWRVLIASWAGGLAAVVVLILVRADLPPARRQRLARYAVGAAAVSALLLAVVAVRFP